MMMFFLSVTFPCARPADAALRRMTGRDTRDLASDAPAVLAGSGRACFAPQHETLDFSGRRLRQAVHELDPTRIFPRSDGPLHMHLELLVEGAIWTIFAPILEHDEGLRLDQPVAVLCRHDGCFENARMGDQGCLDLEGRHPDAAHLEHVIGAAAEDVDSVGTSQILVACARPLALEGAARFLPLVPVASG